jgi:hypothetical protein
MTPSQELALAKIKRDRFGVKWASVDATVEQIGRHVSVELRHKVNHPDFGSALALDSRWLIGPKGGVERTA